LSVAHDPASLRPGGGYGRGEIALDPAIRPALEEWAKKNGFTLYNCFQAAWAIILSRYSGQKDVVFAAVRGCRGVPIEDADRIVGMFINTLPVRARIDDRMPLVDFLKELRGQHVAIREHAHSALAQIQRWSDIPPNMPLFESLINYAGTPWDAYLTSKGGMHGQREWDIRNQTNIPLSFDISEAPEPRIVVDYDRGRFDAAAIEAMLGHFKTIVEAMAENHDRAVGDLPMLTGAERRTILVDWNDRAADFPRGETIHGLFERRAAETPDAPAVVLGDRALSYGVLNGRANQLAHRLLALGVAPETPVAVCMDRTPELVVALLGVLKAGGAYVPIDPAYPGERIAFMLEDTGSPVVLTEEKVAGALPPNDAHEIRVDTGWDEMAGEPDTNPAPVGGPDALAYIIYTSGSTGTPKGVCCRHESVLNLFADFDRRRPIEPGDRCALWTSVSFDVSVYEIFTALLAGGTLYIASDAIRFDAGVFIPWLAEHEIASAYVPPLMLTDLREWVEANPGKSALRRLLVGVEPIPEPLLSAIAAAVPGLSIINGYGPTE
ncbi:MAG TPA: non-ribosomal peptide synthetase, partial [Alphaproteobacteria bacterium]|nr:non-ribosomal peptide synthetase [Alphaproteobacteria bacterium]